MKACGAARWTMVVVACIASFAALGLEAEAQDPVKFLAQTKETARYGWTLLSTIGGVVVGGGALISLAAGMYQGRWGQAAVSFVAGAAGLLALWGVGQVLGF